MERIGVIPYSPDWWKLRHGCFTGSEAYKLMSEPKGKSPFEKWDDAVNKLREFEVKYKTAANKELKSIKTLAVKIEHKKAEVELLNEKKNDYHFSETAETYILEKVHEKLTGIVKNGVDNFSTQWGIEHEPLAKKWYGKLTGNELTEPVMRFHETLEGFSCTPDAFGSITPLSEFKCPANGANHLKHWLINSDEYFKDNHSNYYWQCTSQMVIFKENKLDFVSFDPRINNDKGMFIHNMKLNDEDMQLLESRIAISRELYNDYLNLFSQ